MSKPRSYLNPDLTVLADNKCPWNLPETRRDGFRNLHRKQRYSVSFRSDYIFELTKDIDPRIGSRNDVQRLTNTQHFCAMAVIKDQTLVFEAYAPDFPDEHLHTIMSVTKLLTNLIIGQLVGEGLIDLSKTVDEYLPEIGSGYASATIKQVLDMDLENNYTENYSDPHASIFASEVSYGCRLPADDAPELTMKEFLCSIQAVGETLDNNTGATRYKTANSDILGWIAERVGGRPLRDWVLDIVEATGVEGVWNMQTDRSGFPILGGGTSLTVRDLARFGQLFCRYGKGVNGRQVGDADFIEKTRKEPRHKLIPPMDFCRYSNQTATNGVWLGHAGYGGQFLLANPDTGVSVAFFSVLETKNAIFPEYQAELIRMMESVAEI